MDDAVPGGTGGGAVGGGGAGGGATSAQPTLMASGLTTCVYMVRSAHGELAEKHSCCSLCAT